MEVYGVVYLLIDGTNDKEYVGQTTRTVEERFKKHSKADSYIGRAMRAHGVDMFTTAILKVCYSKEELDRWEKHFIKSRNTKAPNGYNLTDGGEGISGLEFTPEHCAKIGAAQKGKKRPPEVVAKMATARHSETPYKNLLSVITEQKLSYSDLDRLLRLSKTTFSHRMRDKTNFKEREIAKLAEIFGMSAEYLMARDDGTTATTLEAKKYAKLSATIYNSSPFKNLICEMAKYQFSYASLASLLKLDASTVSRKMHGNCIFTAKDITKLVEFFGKPAEYLMARDDNVQ